MIHRASSRSGIYSPQNWLGNNARFVRVYFTKHSPNGLMYDFPFPNTKFFIPNLRFYCCQT